jgi:hypothetical protein
LETFICVVEDEDEDALLEFIMLSLSSADTKADAEVSLDEGGGSASTCMGKRRAVFWLHETIKTIIYVIHSIVQLFLNRFFIL